MGPVLCGEKVTCGGDALGGSLRLIGSFQWDIYCELWEAAIFILKLGGSLTYNGVS